MNQASANPPFYRAFEDRYRGTRETIKARLRAYLPFLEPLQSAPDAHALDLGCGRGEWLELLGELGFRTRGIDLDEGMLAACRERGLDVENMDALAALRAQPDASLAVVSAFHLVEHIPFDLVRDLIHEALRALRPGGLLIMETPNPENLVVGASDFYTDPSHLRPIPPNLLAFATEHGGFARHKIVRLQEDPQLRGGGRVVLGAVLQGASPDYSVVAQKAAPERALAPFDAAFGADYGIDMQQLALRYQTQRDDEHAEIHRNLGRIDTEIAQGLHPALDQIRAEQVEDRVQGAALSTRLDETNRRQAGAGAELVQTNKAHAALAGTVDQLAKRMLATEDRLAQAEARAEVFATRADAADARAESLENRAHVVEMRADAAEARAEMYAQRTADLLDSTSWRVTAPLRSAGALARRLSSAYREGRLSSGARRRVKTGVRGAALFVLRRPRVKRAALRLLNLVPGLRRRLHRLVHRPDPAAVHAAPPPDPLAATTADLPPRAARAYEALLRAQEARNSSQG